MWLKATEDIHSYTDVRVRAVFQALAPGPATGEAGGLSGLGGLAAGARSPRAAGLRLLPLVRDEFVAGSRSSSATERARIARAGPESGVDAGARRGEPGGRQADSACCSSTTRG